MAHLNALAHLELTHHFGGYLAARGRGGLLLTGSTAGLQGVPFSAEYAAAKGFVINLGEALHVELQKAGIHVTVLLPGAIDTPMLTDFGFDLINTPLKPMSPEQCVAEGLAALAANRATHIAGRMNRVMAAVIPRPMATRMYGSMAANVLAKRSGVEGAEINEETLHETNISHDPWPAGGFYHDRYPFTPRIPTWPRSSALRARAYEREDAHDSDRSGGKRRYALSGRRLWRSELGA
jgi:NAD(P)-dependent dehydrogenase (short-subunit alcohol dehydrogenase family)